MHGLYNDRISHFPSTVCSIVNLDVKIAVCVYKLHVDHLSMSGKEVTDLFVNCSQSTHCLLLLLSRSMGDSEQELTNLYSFA